MREETITACQHCKNKIRGGYVSDTAWLGPSSYQRPAFCTSCGKPFPWTERALASADEWVAIAENLDQKEAAALRAALDEIIRDTPEAPTAALKVKGYMKKVGPIAAEGIKELVVAVASSDVAKAFGAS